MISKELIAASTKPLLLAILSQGEDYGYSIIQQVREMSDEQIEWTEGMLYPVLHRLEKEGLIASKWKTSEAGRKRKYYRVSAKGSKALKREREQWFAVHSTLSKLWGAKLCTT
ncbi:MAG: helix-turn-helix transcriptional regulator [Planctomycetales bacterium]|nr:helix-turn-helix transcriptional regulator [Planctomycetales bacterium]